MTNDQQNRIEGIKTKWRHASDGPLKSDIDFLLSLVKSQEADGEVLTDLHNSDCLFVTHSGKCDCPYGPVIKSAATAMRDECVDKVRTKAQFFYSQGLDRTASVLVEAAQELESLTLDQVKPGEM